MDNYIKFWKHLPKFIYGLSFSFFAILLIVGFQSAVEIFSKFDFLSLNSISQIVILILGLIIVSSIGIKIQDLLINISSTIFVHGSLSIKTQNQFDKLNLKELFMTEGQIAKDLFIKFEKDLIQYEYYKSWSQPEGLGQVKGLNLFYKKVSSHIKNISNTEFLVHVNYFGSVTQEQAMIDSLHETVNEFYYLILNIFLLFTVLQMKYATPFAFSILIFSFFLSLLIILPQVKKAKIKLAYYIICGYIDSFTIGESATIIDREPSV